MRLRGMLSADAEFWLSARRFRYQGSRKQDKFDANKYKYSLFYTDLQGDFNTVVVVVKFGTASDGTPNNFVLTAYQVWDYKVK